MEQRPRLEIRRLIRLHMGPLDLSLGPRECVTLSGPSGAGKTLLLRALVDLDPSEGRVYLDGTERMETDPAEWRRQVGMLPAESAWWSDTVREHFAAPNQDELRQVGFGPEVLDWEVSRLSTGERQRLALLRLLSVRPRVLLLDEPTANLDPDNTRRVEGLVRAYLQDHEAACLWVTHNAGQVSRVSSRHLILVGPGLREARGPDPGEASS